MILLGERSRHSRPSSLLSVYGAKIINIIFIKIIILRLFFLKKKIVYCAKITPSGKGVVSDLVKWLSSAI